MEEKDKMTLRKKLMLSFLILVLLMGSMIGYFSYQNAKILYWKTKNKRWLIQLTELISLLIVRFSRSIVWLKM